VVRLYPSDHASLEGAAAEERQREFETLVRRQLELLGEDPAC